MVAYGHHRVACVGADEAFFTAAVAAGWHVGGGGVVRGAPMFADDPGVRMWAPPEGVGRGGRGGSGEAVRRLNICPRQPPGTLVAGAANVRRGVAAGRPGWLSHRTGRGVAVGRRAAASGAALICAAGVDGRGTVALTRTPISVALLHGTLCPHHSHSSPPLPSIDWPGRGTAVPCDRARRTRMCGAPSTSPSSTARRGARRRVANVPAAPVPPPLRPHLFLGKGLPPGGSLSAAQGGSTPLAWVWGGLFGWVVGGKREGPDGSGIGVTHSGMW